MLCFHSILFCVFYFTRIAFHFLVVVVVVVVALDVVWTERIFFWPVYSWSCVKPKVYFMLIKKTFEPIFDYGFKLITASDKSHVCLNFIQRNLNFPNYSLWCFHGLLSTSCLSRSLPSSKDICVITLWCTSGYIWDTIIHCWWFISCLLCNKMIGM